MALINCPECAKEISDTAPSCPHCGFIYNKNMKKSNSLLSAKELYPANVQMLNLAETISWSRFNSFLLYNTVILIIWNVIYNSHICDNLKLLLLLVIGTIGILISFFILFLSIRGRKNVNTHLEIGEKIEKKIGFMVR